MVLIAKAGAVYQLVNAPIQRLIIVSKGTRLSILQRTVNKERIS